MTVFSLKNRCRSSVHSFRPWLAIFSVLYSSAGASATIDLGYRATLTSRLAFHAFGAQDLASHRYSLEVQQNLKSGRWGAAIGARAYSESAFATNSRYPEPVRKRESSDFVVRDLFAEYRDSSALIRLGYQQVVWGEAFGFYYADIVNPKDTREFSLGDLSFQRIASPMANVILFTKPLSLQLLWIPKPFYDETSTFGNDFAFPFDAIAGGRSIDVVHPRAGSLRLLDGSEFGVRVSTLIAGYDLSFFTLHFAQRSPTYRVEASPTTVRFLGEHPRTQAYGLTATKDWGPLLGRLECIYTNEKPLDYFQPQPATDPALGYGTATSDEWTAVAGLDYPGIPKWRLGTQVSHRYLARAIPGAFASRNTSILTVFTNGPLARNAILDALYSYDPQGGSSQLQASVLFPVQDQVEFTLGAQLMVGNGSSLFGRMQRGSRVYATLRAFLDGGRN